MQIRELKVSNAWEFTPHQHQDQRGTFLEFYRIEQLEATVGHGLSLKQGNLSVSSKGVVRGIHYALVPPGQAKYVTAVRGAFIDYIVDLRVGSPTFGEWDSVVIDDVSRRAVYLAEGLGHAIISLTDSSTVSYLVSEVFDPTRELSLDVLDPQLGLEFPVPTSDMVMSPKDASAQSFEEACDSGLLPTWQQCQELYSSLATGR